MPLFKNYCNNEENFSLYYMTLENKTVPMWTFYTLFLSLFHSIPVLPVCVCVCVCYCCACLRNWDTFYKFSKQIATWKSIGIFCIIFQKVKSPTEYISYRAYLRKVGQISFVINVTSENLYIIVIALPGLNIYIFVNKYIYIRRVVSIECHKRTST